MTTVTTAAVTRPTGWLSAPGIAAAPTASEVARAIGAVGVAVGGLAAGDPRWDRVRPLVTELAGAVRAALGTSAVASGGPVADVARQRDLAVAARGLQSPGVGLRDPDAATDALRVAEKLLDELY